MVDLIFDPFPAVGCIAVGALLVYQAAYVHERVEKLEQLHNIVRYGRHEGTLSLQMLLIDPAYCLQALLNALVFIVGACQWRRLRVHEEYGVAHGGDTRCTRPTRFVMNDLLMVTFRKIAKLVLLQKVQLSEE